MEDLWRRERGGEELEAKLWRDGERLWVEVREVKEEREGGGGASPKMKNLMKAPSRRTTESWPRSRPWVKESL